MDKNEISILFPLPAFPYSHGALIRELGIACALQHKGFEVTIYCASEGEPFSGRLSGIKINQSYFKKSPSYILNMLFSKRFSHPLPRDWNESKGCGYMLSHPSFINSMREQGISDFVLDEHNVNWELFGFNSHDFRSSIYNRFCKNRDIATEIDALKRASHVIVCSNTDKEKIALRIQDIEDKISVIPNCVDYLDYQGEFTDLGLIERYSPYVVFMGTFSYGPSAEAVRLICEKIAPNVKSDVTFLIIGRNPPRIEHPRNVQFLGYVEDVKPYIFNSAASICPLLGGSGTRIKILESMAMGRLVVSTSKGCEGINAVTNKHIIIEDRIEAFAGLIDDIVTNEAAYSQVGCNARRLIGEEYDWRGYSDLLCKIFSKWY